MALLTVSIFLTSCSSTSKRRELLVQVIDGQNEILRKLSEERKAEALSKKVSKDAELSKAERHLDQAIQALLESNVAVKTVL